MTDHTHHQEDNVPTADQTTALTGSDYVLAVAHALTGLGVPVDHTALDLDEERSAIPIADGNEPTWLHWAADPDDGWHLTDDQGRAQAPICPPDTPVDEAARILARYI